MTQEVLKLALEALKAAQELAGKHDAELEYGFQQVITAIKEALAQPEQEPWCMKMNGCKTKCEDCPVEVAQPKQETVADDFFKMIADRNPKPFSPPERTWIGLTDVEIDYLLGSTVGENEETHISFARAIEAKLKERN
jgi:hypothetical protein